VAFTDAQERDIRKYMGVPFGFYDLNSRLESMMDMVGANATDSAQIIEWLDRLTEIDEALTSSESSGSASTYGAIKKVDDVEFFEPSDGADASESSIALVEQGRVLIGRIARAFGVSDYLPIGDYFAAIKRTGFVIPLG
jgi:hypothetical protein